METINTIATNAVILWNSPIDWSPTAGPIWLLGYVVIAVPTFVYGAWHLEKEKEKREIYEAAEKMAAYRLEWMEALGYMEYRNR